MTLARQAAAQTRTVRNRDINLAAVIVNRGTQHYERHTCGNCVLQREALQMEGPFRPAMKHRYPRDTGWSLLHRSDRHGELRRGGGLATSQTRGCTTFQPSSQTPTPHAPRRHCTATRTEIPCQPCELACPMGRLSSTATRTQHDGPRSSLSPGAAARLYARNRSRRRDHSPRHCSNAMNYTGLDPDELRSQTMLLVQRSRRHAAMSNDAANTLTTGSPAPIAAGGSRYVKHRRSKVNRRGFWTTLVE